MLKGHVERSMTKDVPRPRSSCDHHGCHTKTQHHWTRGSRPNIHTHNDGRPPANLNIVRVQLRDNAKGINDHQGDLPKEGAVWKTTSSSNPTRRFRLSLEGHDTEVKGEEEHRNGPPWRKKRHPRMPQRRREHGKEHSRWCVVKTRPHL